MRAGGPDESLPLAQLAATRAELNAALTTARVHAVPRPRRSRYAALRAEVAAFAAGLGSMGRVCALLHALCPQPTPMSLTSSAYAHGSSLPQAPASLPPLSLEDAASLRRAVAEAGSWQSNAGGRGVLASKHKCCRRLALVVVF
jgi:hypothetical protein